jgi:hypothetical protein
MNREQPNMRLLVILSLVLVACGEISLEAQAESAREKHRRNAELWQSYIDYPQTAILRFRQPLDVKISRRDKSLAYCVAITNALGDGFADCFPKYERRFPADRDKIIALSTDREYFGLDNPNQGE